MYKPEPDSRYQKPYRIQKETGEVVIAPMVPEDSITTGENPFIQLIYRFCKQPKTFEDIARHLIHEKKVLPDNIFSRKKIKVFVYEMHIGSDLGGLLIKRGGGYLAGVPLKLGRRIIKLNLGYDPFEYETLNYAEHRGTISRNEVYQILSRTGNRYKWARNDGTINYYIDKLLKEGNLVLVGDDWYRYKKYPKRMS